MFVNCNKYGEKRKDNKKENNNTCNNTHVIVHMLKKFYSTYNCKVMTKLAT